ncbi:MAG: hypothetical protein EBR00_04945 [Gammaproteobacteria bacterium]|nr:hypothetical protein [Gammaproteobacteria bacterium]
MAYERKHQQGRLARGRDRGRGDRWLGGCHRASFSGVSAHGLRTSPSLGGSRRGVIANAVKALDWLGVGEHVRQIADEPLQQLTCHYASGDLLVSFDRHNTREQYGAPYLQMHRADLHALLVERLRALAPDAIQIDHRLVEVSLSDDATSQGVSLRFENSAGREIERRVPAVIGADGLKSLVRRTLWQVEPPAYSGFVAWRGLAEASQIQAELSEGSKVFAGPGRLFVRYPIRQGRLMNYVAFLKVAEPQGESWSQQGEVTELQALLVGFHSEVAAILAATPEGRCHKWGLYARTPLAQWSRGDVVLLGDAAHPMMPWFGQGAASALEDAVILGRCLQESTSMAEAADRFQRTRLERVSFIHRESQAGGERLTALHPERLRDSAVRNEDSLGLMSYDPVLGPLCA